jgi:hypothetical protein
MSDQVLIAFAASLAPTLLATATLVVAMRGVRKVEQVARVTEEVHKATNSLTDRLVETTRTDAHARGVLDEKERAESQQPDQKQEPAGGSETL